MEKTKTKTITISEKIWNRLRKNKIDLNVSSYDDVIGILLDKFEMNVKRK